MRLGFWSRMAVAVIGLTVAIYTPYATHQDQVEAQNAASVIQGLCLDKPYGENYAANLAECNKNFEEQFMRSYTNLDDIQFAAAFGVFYGALIWLALRILAALAAWVWRGREIKNTEKA